MTATMTDELTEAERAELEEIADAFLGTTFWEVHHAEDPDSSDTGKFYRVLVRCDGKGQAWAQYGRRPFGSDAQFGSCLGEQVRAYTPKQARAKWREKMRKTYIPVVSFKFRGPVQDPDFNTVVNLAAAAMRDPDLQHPIE